MSQPKPEGQQQAYVNKLPLWSKCVLGGVAVTAVAAVAWGANQMTREDNWEDFNRLKEFTSADHQQDRCEVQAAVDAQEKMRLHFAEKGGITPEEAAAFAPAVGLEEREIIELLNTELYKFSYDCVDANGVASTQEATIGLAAVGVGGGVLIGLGVGTALARRRREDAIVEPPRAA